MRFTRAAVVTLLVLSMRADPGSGDHVKSPPTLVPNPIAEAWAAFAPGAWTRRRVLKVNMQRKLVPVGEELTVLVETTKDDVVLRDGTPPDAPGGAVTWEPDQSDRLDRRIEAHGVFGSAFQPWQIMEVKMGAERLEVGGKTVECTTYEALERDGTLLTRGFKLWLAPGIPGGVVREEWSTELGGGGRWSTHAWELVAAGPKPDGTFPWPLPPDARYDWKEAEAYARWAKTPVGAWIRQTTTQIQAGKDPYVITSTSRLREVRPTRLVLEVTQAEEPRHFFRGVQRLKLPSEAEPAPTATKVGTEALTAAGRAVACTVLRREYPSWSGGGNVTTVTEWLSPEIPGSVLKQVSVETGGPFAGVVTTLTEAWGKD